MQAQRFNLSRPLPLPVRLALGAAGLFCVLMPAWEFRHALLQPSVLTVFFGIIVLGGWAVGASFLMAAFFGEAQTWRFGSGRMFIARRSAFLAKTDTVHGRDVASIDVSETVWDSRAPTFSVVIHTKTGARYGSAEHQTRAEAEALAALVRAKLKLH